ncbi:MAG: hypothetical protein E6R13_04440 [Spirochaetes bacterium]|nr:MAG: hypothetical protein E6R13_04440 [Spirochaetota bacterium]
MVKISDLPDGGGLKLNDILVGNRAGITNKFSVNSVFKKSQIIYVDNIVGLDSANNNGSINLPYKSINYALTQITDAEQIRPYTINCNTGSYAETDLHLKPWIYIEGNNSFLTVTNQVIGDTSWSGGGYSGISNFNNVDFQNGINLDFDALSSPFAVFQISGMITQDTKNFTFKGNPTGTAILIFEKIFGFSGSPDFNITDCYGGLFSSNLNSLSVFESAAATGGFVFSSIVNSVQGNINVTVSGAHDCYFVSKSTTPDGSVNLNSSAGILNYIVDSTSVMSNSIPVVTGSSVNIQYKTVSDGITANYTPTNYTPTNPQVKGHLEGIDNALGAAAMLPQTNIVYVSTYGNDSTGDGTQEKPFASLFKAMTYLSTLVSPTAQYAVCLDPGQYNETSAVPIIPNVTVYASGENTSVILNNSVSISTLWNTGNVYNNLFFTNISFASALSLDFSTATNTTVTNRVFFDNCQFLFGLTLNGSSANSPFYNTEFYIRNCQNILTSISFDNCYTYFDGGFFGSQLNIGTGTATCQTEFDVLSTICTKLNINATSGSFSTRGDIRACKFSLPSTISGATTTISSDDSLWSPGNPVVTSANVVKTTKSNAILTNNTTPFVNFTPTDNSVLGSLLGIDTALGLATGVKTNDVWVSNQGSNTTGNGTIEKPYQTIIYALSQITTNSSSNIFKIVCTSGVYNETAIVLKPYVYIDGQGSTLNVTGSITADSTFNSVGGNIIFGNFFNSNVSGQFNFDVSSGTQPVGIYIHNFNLEGNLTLNVKGNNSSSFSTYCVINNVESSLGLIPVSLENVFGYIDACTVSTFSYLSNNPSIVFNFDSYGTTYVGGSGISISGVSPSGVTTNWSANDIISSSFVVDGSVNLKIDVSSCRSNNIPVATGGAIISYVNVADTLSANYTPTNYTPVSSTVKGHLQGINNALSTTGLDSLQTAYNNGANGTIVAISGKPVNTTTANPALSEVYDPSGNGQYRLYGLPVPNPSFTSPPTSTSTNSTIDNYGFLFHPNFNLHGVKVGFLSSELPSPSSSRLIGIFRVSDNALIASTTVTGISALDSTNTYRTEFITDVYLPTTDDYVLQAVYPSGSTIRGGVPTGIDSNISILGSCSAVNHPTLTYPTVINNVVNNVFGSAVVLESLATNNEVFYVGSQGVKNLYSKMSTTFPVIVSSTGFSSVLLTNSFYHRIGNVIHMIAALSCTPNTQNGTILLLVPYSSGWTNVNTDVIGEGTLVDPLNPIRYASVVRVNASGANPQAVSVTTGVSPLAFGNVHLLKLSFMYTANAV